MSWTDFDSGSSLGTRGSENGIIFRDFEHSSGARVTVERDGDTAPFSINALATFVGLDRLVVVRASVVPGERVAPRGDGDDQDVIRHKTVAEDLQALRARFRLIDWDAEVLNRPSPWHILEGTSL